jgi:hypothetical protein
MGIDIEEIFMKCLYCEKICKIKYLFCCNNHKYLYDERKILEAKIEGRWRID